MPQGIKNDLAHTTAHPFRSILQKSPPRRDPFSCAALSLAHPNSRRYPTSDAPVVLINLLWVKHGKQNAPAALLNENIDTVICTLHGLKVARLVGASDGTGVVIYSEWETPATVEAMRNDPAMLADGVKLTPDFTRYAKWRFALGAVEGQPSMLVFDGTGTMESPAHFVLIEWPDDRITGIRDFLFSPYLLEVIDWVRPG